ncbi:MAG TPA: translation initiation factor 2 [Anaeromyxobacter sp.]
MKTLTELSGTLIRMAAAAVAEARGSLPAEKTPAPEAPAQPEAQPEPPAEAAAAEAPAEAATSADAGGDAVVGEATGDAVAAAPAPAPARAAKPAPAADSPQVKAALDEAVAKATGLSGDRLAMLRAAVEVVGKRAADVRLVRVFGVEEKVSGAITSGDHQYVVDHFPQSMRQVTGGGRDDRGGKGGKGGRGGGGGGGGRGGGGGKGAPTSGGFSMDSLREDRKGARGRPGGGPRGPGAGRSPGGGTGGPPRGEPKK